MTGRDLAILVTSAVLCGTLAGAVSVARADRFSGTTSVVLDLDALRAPSAFEPSNRVPTEADRLLRTEREHLASREVVLAAARTLGTSPAVLADAVDYTAGQSWNALTVVAQGRSDAQAQAYSDAVVVAYIRVRRGEREHQISRQINALDVRRSELLGQLRTAPNQRSQGPVVDEYARLTAARGDLMAQRALGSAFAQVVHPPRFRAVPVGLGPLRSAAVGAGLGLFLALGVLLLLRQSSRRIQHPTQAAEVTGMGVAATLRLVEPTGAPPRVGADDETLHALPDRLRLLAGGRMDRIELVAPESPVRVRAVAEALVDGFALAGRPASVVDPSTPGPAVKRATSNGDPAVQLLVGPSATQPAADLVLLLVTLGESPVEETRALAHALTQRVLGGAALLLLQPRQSRSAHRWTPPADRPASSAPPSWGSVYDASR